MAGTLTISTLSDGTNSTSATNCIQGSAKAWVNFNGTGTVAIRASYNVSSITDNGTGDYTVNFTTAMPDANYSVNYSIGAYTPTETYDRFGWITAASNTTSSCRVRVRSNSNIGYDEVYNNVAIFR